MNSRSLFYFVYRNFAMPLMRALFYVLALFLPKIRLGLEARRNQPWLSPVTVKSPTIWIHAASGEFEYAKPVIARLKLKRPDLRIVVTYFSPTFAKAVHAFPGVDFATPLPWDTPSALKEFIASQNPSTLLIARTDTWPEMLRQAKENGLATCLFSATLPSNAGRVRSRLGRWMTRSTFSYIDHVFCVSQEDQESFARLGLGERASVGGDTRYDQVMERLQKPKPLKDELFSDHSPERVLVCGSTWPEDEAVLIDAASQLKQIDFVLVPHEPTSEHLLSLEAQIEARGLASVRYSTATTWPTNSVLLIDKIGILAELYQKGRLAFVGGSFKKTVHSVMEPLASGCFTFVGPLHLNNREAIEFRGVEIAPRLDAVTAVTNAAELVAKISNAPTASELQEKIRREIQARAGKSDLVVNWTISRTDSTKL